jgi:hypothetical protein
MPYPSSDKCKNNAEQATFETVDVRRHRSGIIALLHAAKLPPALVTLASAVAASG